MISKDITAKNLQDYYQQLCDLQAKHHTPEYLLVHNEIRQLLNNCTSYTEFGVNQGTTLAVAVLSNIPKIRAYDIKLAPYNKAKHHFEQYASENKLDYRVIEAGTLTIKIDPVDLLYIDTVHSYSHLKQELEKHGSKAQKYIVFHDTVYAPGLRQAVNEYVNAHKNWKIITDCIDSVGFMTIKNN